MGITSAIVLYAVIWWLTLFVILPLRMKTQQDLGEVTPGTQSGSPEVHHFKAKVLITTGVATLLFVVIAGIILSGWITLEDIDMFHRLRPPAQ